MSNIDVFGIKNVNFSCFGIIDREKEPYKSQRIDRGFDDTELWNLDYTIIKFIAPRLDAFVTKELSKDGYDEGGPLLAEFSRLRDKFNFWSESFYNYMTDNQVKNDLISFANHWTLLWD